MTAIKRNAVIMAAGTSSRFVPLSAERPKGLLEVKGEVLIERQIRQLREAGISDITIVVGYKAEMFEYLKEKFGVSIVMNEDFERYNNTSSLVRVTDRLHNTYICSSDNYFPENVFKGNPQQSYYSGKYCIGKTGEYCITTDEEDNITGVTVGGTDSWYMIGHVYFSDDFSTAFKSMLERSYQDEESTRLGYWEDLYIRNIDKLPALKLHRYESREIEEFDSLDELREFDESYVEDTRSDIIKRISRRLGCRESELSDFRKIKTDGNNLKFSFLRGTERMTFDEASDTIIR